MGNRYYYFNVYNCYAVTCNFMQLQCLDVETIYNWKKWKIGT